MVNGSIKWIKHPGGIPGTNSYLFVSDMGEYHIWPFIKPDKSIGYIPYWVKSTYRKGKVWHPLSDIPLSLEWAKELIRKHRKLTGENKYTPYQKEWRT